MVSESADSAYVAPFESVSCTPFAHATVAVETGAALVYVPMMPAHCPGVPAVGMTPALLRKQAPPGPALPGVQIQAPHSLVASHKVSHCVKSPLP